MPEVKIKDVMEAVSELRLEVEKKGGADQEKLAKINAVLDKHEESNQKLISEIKSAEDREKEHKERIEALELELAKSGESKNVDYRETKEYKALEAYAKRGIEDLDPEFKATLRTDNDSQGGYLVHSEIDNMVTKKITEVSGLRSVSRVKTIASKTLEMAIRTGIPTATYEGEKGTSQESISAYGNETLTAYRLTHTVPVTHDQLMNSSFDMEAEIFGDSAEAFAQAEGNKFILGTDVKQPEGILTNSTVVANARTSSTSGTVDADDVILLTGDLKTGYNPAYVMNRKTLAFLRTLKSTDGVFLWQPGMNGPVANTINGFPYVLANDMPDIASNSLSIAFGDFQRGYTIIDRTGVSVIRDDYTKKTTGVVEFTLHRWNYGKVTLPEAIKLLKTAA